MPPKSKSNMRDVAKHADVSATTVSMVLRNDPRITEPTRKKVLTAIKELNYSANPMVSALMQQVQRRRRVKNDTKLALLGPKGNCKLSMESEFDYAANVMEGMRERATELGYSNIEVCEPEGDPYDLGQVIKVLTYRGIRGALLPPFIDPEAVHHEYDFNFSNMALVAAGHSQNVSGINRIAHDQYAVTFETTRRLLSRGYRRIGLAMQKEYELRTGSRYTGGFLGALRIEGVTAVEQSAIFYRDDIPGDALPELLTGWIRENELDTIITQDLNDYRILNEAGFRIPEDLGLSLLATNASHLPQFGFKGMRKPSGMYHDPFEIGLAAVDLLTAQITRNEYGRPPFPKTILTSPKWEDGATLRNSA